MLHTPTSWFFVTASIGELQDEIKRLSAMEALSCRHDDRGRRRMEKTG
jgi:hypothetical protein